LEADALSMKLVFGAGKKAFAKIKYFAQIVMFSVSTFKVCPEIAVLS
jgi:hypothetical protein